ncbi:hypothetical protein [Rhodopirellula sp. MGV]|uniref:hypothetical protein n=1 Tax=Rhodopirellula sp. MGV TaxID=2023130 RepID=UPI00117A16C6|nr:hypothetical protein [Rhodopirellula sp. MGV]
MSCISMASFAAGPVLLFDPGSASQTDGTLHMVVVTDDPASPPDERDVIASSENLWCGQAINALISDLYETRPDLNGKLKLHQIAAGWPKQLLAGENDPLPQRAIVFLCDREQQVLDFCVGVPGQAELIDMIESSEETASLLSIQADQPTKLAKQLVDRAKERVHRNYRELIESQLLEDFATSTESADAAWLKNYESLVVQLLPLYTVDFNLRFNAPMAINSPRLRILEQHCEARHDWCETVLPMLVGKQLRRVIHPVVDSVWQAPPVIDLSEGSHADLLEWFQSRRDVATIVFAITPDVITQQVSWPPPNVNPKMRGRSWSDLEIAMSKHAFRGVTAEELAVILQVETQVSLNALVPSRLRYLVFRPKEGKPVEIRESDLPSKFIRRF